MSKTDYVIIPEPKIEFMAEDNPEKATAQYLKNNPDIKRVMVVPRSAAKLNGKRIKPKPSSELPPPEGRRHPAASDSY